MNAEIFYEYFANYFLKWLKDQSDIKFPIVMFLDGHKSHLSYHLSKLCSQSQIILIALPPNTTHMMQVLDVAIFNPVKQGWSVSVHELCMTKLLEEDEPLTKFNFAPLMKKLLDQTMKRLLSSMVSELAG